MKLTAGNSGNWQSALGNRAIKSGTHSWEVVVESAVGKNSSPSIYPSIAMLFTFTHIDLEISPCPSHIHILSILFYSILFYSIFDDCRRRSMVQRDDRSV